MASIKTLEDYNGNKIIPNTISDSVYIDEIGSGKETLKTRLNDIRAKLDTVNSSKVDRVELDSSTNELVFSAGINEIARITIATQSKNFTGLTLNSADGKIYLADENGNAFGSGIKIIFDAESPKIFLPSIKIPLSNAFSSSLGIIDMFFWFPYGSINAILINLTSSSSTYCKMLFFV